MEQNNKPLPETPAQAALHEPDMFEDEATAQLREVLTDRLNENLSEYVYALHDIHKLGLSDLSHEIAGKASAHHYLTEVHNFHKSELDYLLQFKNPLAVVADQFEWTLGEEDRSAVMWDIFDKQEALQGKYALVPGPATIEARKRELFARLDANLSDYCEALMGTDKAELIGMAEEIAIRYAVRDYLKSEHDFTPQEVAFLLQFREPLTVVCDRYQGAFFGHEHLGEAVANVFKDWEWIQQELGYAPTSDSVGIPSTPEEKRHNKGDGDKASVLEQLKKARVDAKEKPAPQKAPQKDTPGQDYGPEL